MSTQDYQAIEAIVYLGLFIVAGFVSGIVAIAITGFIGYCIGQSMDVFFNGLGSALFAIIWFGLCALSMYLINSSGKAKE